MEEKQPKDTKKLLKKDECIEKKFYTHGTYIGEVDEEGEHHGKGVFTWKNGDKYDGEWKHGQGEGKAVKKWSDGDKYVGEFKSGKYHGKGVYEWSNGDKYDGEFKDNCFVGKATFTMKNTGAKFVGESTEWFNYESKTVGSMVGSVFDKNGLEFKGKWNSWKNKVNNIRYLVDVAQKYLLNRETGEVFASELKEDKKWMEGKSLSTKKNKK